MNFLKRIADTIIRFAGIATGFVPLLQGLAPGRATEIQSVSDDLTKVAGIVTVIEAAAAAMTTPADGAEKLKMATPLVAQIILQSDLLVGHKVKDAAKFQAGCASVASGIADVLSSLEG